MNVQTHLFVAAAMERHIYKKYKLLLDQSYFYYGSIQPDLKMRSRHKVSHTYKDSFPYFFRDWKMMKRVHLFRGLKVFSYKLGLMLHYTGDFFTYAHHDEALFHKQIRHYRYERALYREFRQTARRNPRLPLIGDDVRIFFEQSLVLYHQGAGLPAHDADFIYFASVAVCDALIEGVYFERR